MENWSKTLLYAYRYLQTIVNTIDEMVNNITFGSIRYNSKSSDNTMSQIERVIELNDRKCRLINVKVIVEEGLIKLCPKDLEVMSLYFIDGLEVSDICDTLNISRRTFYRRKSIATKQMANYLASLYTSEYFLQEFETERWLLDFYYFVSKKAESNISYTCDIYDEGYKNGREIFKALKEIRRMAI